MHGTIVPRSGMTIEGTITEIGIIDPDYIGELFVMIHNTTNTIKNIQAGTRVAQLIVGRTFQPIILEKQKQTEKEQSYNKPLTRRGGFGSSGRL